MRVEKINLNTSSKMPSYSNKAALFLNKENFDTVSFEGKKDKPSLKEKIASFFRKDDLTEEEEASEEIRCLVEDTGLISKKVNQNAKYYTSIAKSLIRIGEMENFTNYITYDKKNNKRLVFGKIDEQTGIPSSISVVNMNKGFKVEDSYEFYDGLNLFSVQSEANDNTDVNFTILNGKVISYIEYDKDTNSRKEFVPSQNGFYFFDGKKDENDNVLEKNIEIFFSHKENEESSVFVVDDDGAPHNYVYDSKTDFWKEI